MKIIDVLKNSLDEVDNQIRLYTNELSEVEKYGTTSKWSADELSEKIYDLYTEKRKLVESITVHNSTPVTSNEIIDLYKTGKEPYKYYLICMHDTKIVIGNLGYNQQNSNVHYFINKEYRGNGYAARALELLIEYLTFDGIEEISITIEKDNEASIKVIEKLALSMDNVTVTEKTNDITYHIVLNNKLNAVAAVNRM